MPAVLHVATPLMSGPDVHHLQHQLTTLGYAPGAVDGYYGPATAAAVQAFQRDHGLQVDGVVGPQTWNAIGSAKPHPGGPPVVRAPSDLGKKALAEALKHIGVKESPPNSNDTPFGKWFGVNGVPWCNIFVSYCFAVGAGYDICHGFKGAGVYTKGCTYVPTTEAWLRATGMWRGRTTPLPGDVAIYNFYGTGADHIGIVESAGSGGAFNAVEGNTALGNDSDGGEVMRRQRYLTQVDGFGRVGR
jgi:hypothetical protein